MKQRVRCACACSFLILMALAAPNAHAQEHWVATWAASPQTPRFSFPRFPTPAAQPNNSQSAPAPAGPGQSASPAALSSSADN